MTPSAYIPQRRYPIGTQTFSVLRERGDIYVDKTAYIYRLAHGNTRYFFLSRPRRFGKSLLVSTLRSYFEGRKELFEGLAIEQLEEEWTQYSVLHFDMSMGKHLDQAALGRYLLFILNDNEQRFGIKGESEDPNLRLTTLIRTVYQQTGKQVVVLIDEYDAPLLDVVHEEEDLPKLRQVMRNFYSPLKACDPYLRFVFLTGITKFSQLSIFSELNNIKNISMLPEYAALCGISKEELLTQMAPDIDLLAERLGKTGEQVVADLIYRYDGYHFTWPSPDIFNPYSLMNAFSDGRLESYWFGSGTPTYLIEMLRKFGVKASDIGQREAQQESFDAPTETLTTITPLLYQSGYLTIKDYDEETQTYLLDIPNHEIRMGLMRSLMPCYVASPPENRDSLMAGMYRALKKRDMDSALRLMQAYLLTIPYTDNTAYEGHYQQVLYILFSLLGYYVDVEVHTATGRVDLVLRTQTDLYLIEVKLNADAQTALRQIDLKDYAKRFAECGLPLTKVGITFDQQTRTISEWVIAANSAPSHIPPQRTADIDHAG